MLFFFPANALSLLHFGTAHSAVASQLLDQPAMVLCNSQCFVCSPNIEYVFCVNSKAHEAFETFIVWIVLSLFFLLRFTNENNTFYSILCISTKQSFNLQSNVDELCSSDVESARFPNEIVDHLSFEIQWHIISLLT